jgi:hypothetical protein
MLGVVADFQDFMIIVQGHPVPPSGLVMSLSSDRVTSKCWEGTARS